MTTAAILRNGVCETTVTTGTGTISLGGAQPPFKKLRDRFATGEWVAYVIKLQNFDGSGNLISVEQEEGFGKLTFGTPDTLSRLFVGSSTNADALVNFSAGTKLVYCAAIAEVAGWNLAGVEARTSAKTLNVTHNNLTLALNATSGAITQNLPAATDIFNGYRVRVVKTDSSANAVTLDGASSDTINGATTYVLSKQNDSVEVIWNGSAWYIGGQPALSSSATTFLNTPSSANLRSLMSDETGTGLLYFQGGALGTPASGTLSGCSGYPAATILSSLLTVDGSGSGLDADLWDGANFASYINQALLTGSNVRFNQLSTTNNVFIDGGTVYIGNTAGIYTTIDYNGAVVPSGGSFHVHGTLSKDAGSFRIPHPLPAMRDTHYLVHSFVEAPIADLIYRGRVQLANGIATVNVDMSAKMTVGTLEQLVRTGDADCFLQNRTGWDQVRPELIGNTLTITSNNPSCNDSVSWVIFGERKDQKILECIMTDDEGHVITEPKMDYMVAGLKAYRADELLRFLQEA